MMQLLWKTVCLFFKNLNTELPSITAWPGERGPLPPRAEVAGCKRALLTRAGLAGGQRSVPCGKGQDNHSSTASAVLGAASDHGWRPGPWAPFPRLDLIGAGWGNGFPGSRPPPVRTTGAGDSLRQCWVTASPRRPCPCDLFCCISAQGARVESPIRGEPPPQGTCLPRMTKEGHGSTLCGKAAATKGNP